MMVSRRGLWFAGFAALVGACEPGNTFVDNTNPEPEPCQDFMDCYEDGRLEIGTECINNQCVCPDPEDAWLPCCLKGAPPEECKKMCRRPELCAESASGASSSSSGAGGTGGASGGACTTSADCPGAADPECGEAQCIEGRCSILFRPFDKLKSQVLGDCRSSYCDGAGHVIVLADGKDAYNDGNQCTLDYCMVGSPGEILVSNQWFPDGAVCPEASSGVCFEGRCVDCIANMALCGASLACDFTACVPMHCVNGVHDAALGETDLDCGGLCKPCITGGICKVGADCVDGVCVGGNCKPPSCADGVRNDGETDVDCGGAPSCTRCADGQHCTVAADCLSGVCWAGVCIEPKCDDGVKNGDESNIDCGGVCTPCGAK